jgi:hypothetical protein
LEYKQVTVSNTWVRCRQECRLIFHAVAKSVQPLITAIDQTDKTLAVTWCVLQTYRSPDLLSDVFISLVAQTSRCFYSLKHYLYTTMPGHTSFVPQWTSWTPDTGRSSPLLPVVLTWHHRTSTFSSNWRSTLRSALPNWWRRPRGGQAMATGFRSGDCACPSADPSLTKLFVQECGHLLWMCNGAPSCCKQYLVYLTVAGALVTTSTCHSR